LEPALPSPRLTPATPHAQIIDEIVQAGMVLETNISDIMTALDGMKKHEKGSKGKSA